MNELPKIWIIGNKGMLGKELSLVLEKEFPGAVAGSDREVDITNPDALAAFAEKQMEDGIPIDWIINCAGYTAVDKAEDEPEICRSLNETGTANIARCAVKTGSRLVHISTDYVFDGKGIIDPGTDSPRPYREDDPTAPIGIYGRTKQNGETEALKNCGTSYIIRTAWLYGKNGNNFVHTMLRLMNEKENISVVNDQFGSPTWAYDLSYAILTLIKTANPGTAVPYGIYHYTNEGVISWFLFAKEILKQGLNLNLINKDCKINPCTTAEFPAKAARPAYSALDKSKIKTTLKIEIPDWNTSLEEYLKTARG